MKQYARVFKYIGAYRGQITLYFICIVLSILFSLISIGMLMPFLELIFYGNESGVGVLSTKSSNVALSFIRDFLRNSLGDDLTSMEAKTKILGLICLVIVGSIFLKNLFLYTASYILNPLKNKVVNQVRSELYDKILHLPIGYFTEKRKGDLISRITNDLAEVEGSVVSTVEGLIKDPLMILINFGFLLFLSPQLTLIVLITIPIIGVLLGRVSKSLKKHSGVVAEKYAESVSILDETLSGLRIIKAFNIENLLKTRFFTSNNELLEAKNKIGYRRDLASPMSEFLGVTVFACILFFGGRLVLTGRLLEASAFMTYLAGFYNIINPAKTLSTSLSNMRKGSAAIDRIEEVLQTENAIDDNVNGKVLGSFSTAIELRNVSFDYNGHPVLKNINLTVAKGRTVALVGSSGAGKSTLADLIPRFHDVSSGELLIDGVNIKDYSLRSVREQISIVTQEAILFNDTIERNILLGKQNASVEEVEAASKVANAHGFITKKELGFQENTGDRGMKLSGGERQRLTIARAVIKNPPILILDEATSSLDTESERLVQEAINNMMMNRTSIVIAHRLSTIRHADEIIVLQKGEIVERGNHEQLMTKQGYYFRLVQMQEVK